MPPSLFLFMISAMVAKKKKVIVALSGGVDSSVTCALLKKQGYKVEAIFMKNWTPQSKEEGLIMCPLTGDEKDARLLASQLRIKLSVISFEEDYRREVVENLFSEYKAGRTPNPDVLCNAKVKFNVLLKKALSLGADYVATGHYARKNFQTGCYHLLQGKDQNKDQSYFLYQINQEQLAKCLFPIGEYEKPEVRKLAKKFNLPTASKPDSQGICFVGEVAMKEFLKQRIKPKKGDVVDTDGKKIGEHDGVWYYTIGQRKGIGIGGGLPYYVVGKDMIKNRLIAARADHDEALFKKEMKVSEPHWVSGQKPKLPLNCQVKIRYRQNEQNCIITSIAVNIARVIFAEPQRAVTPGQFAVFYQNKTCLGGGKII